MHLLAFLGENATLFIILIINGLMNELINLEKKKRVLAVIKSNLID